MLAVTRARATTCRHRNAGRVVVNSSLPSLAGLGDPPPDRTALRERGMRAGVPLSGGQVVALADAAQRRVDLERRQRAQCARLAQLLPLPQIRLPYLFTTDIGPAEVDALADAFATGVAAIDLPNAS